MLDCDVAGGRGFEPLYRGPEPRVLPLDDPPERRTRLPSAPDAVNGGSLFALRGLEVRTEPDQEEHEEPHRDHDVETARVGPDGFPVLPEGDADPREPERPEERAQEGIEREASQRDARRAGGEGDE